MASKFRIKKIATVKDLKRARKLLDDLNVDPIGVNIMAPKMITKLFAIKDLDLKAANILKQECLAIGAELALPKEACELRGEKTDAVLIGTLKQIEWLIVKLRPQHYGLPELAGQLKKII